MPVNKTYRPKLYQSFNYCITTVLKFFLTKSYNVFDKSTLKFTRLSIYPASTGPCTLVMLTPVYIHCSKPLLICSMYAL